MQGKKLYYIAEIYLSEFSAEKNLEKTTIKNKRNAMKRLFAFLDGRALTLEISRLYIQDLIKQGYQPSSIRAEVKYLRSFGNFLSKRKYAADNFAKELLFPKVPKKPMKVISPEILEKIIFAGTQPQPFVFGVGGDNPRSIYIKEETRQALRFILRTGLRISEVIKLKGSDLNLDGENPTFYVLSKGGDTDEMPLPLDMIDELKKRVKRKRLFEITADCCNKSLQRGAQILGITTPVSNHALRHAFATSRLNANVPLQKVSRLLRHANVLITDQYYSHFSTTDLSLVLNNQPIIRQGLTPDEIFTNIEQTIKATNIEKDNRFNFKIEKTNNEMKIILSVKNL